MKAEVVLYDERTHPHLRRSGQSKVKQLMEYAGWY